MHNPTQKFRQGSMVFEEPGILSEKVKFLTSSNYLILFFEIYTYFLLTNVFKRVFKICFILFRSWVICQNKKRLDFYTLTETCFYQ